MHEGVSGMKTFSHCITIGASQLKTQVSRILLNTAVRDIGLRSVSIDFGLEIFPNGRTVRTFPQPGNMTFSNRRVKHGTNRDANTI